MGGRERGDYRQGEQAVGPSGLPHAWRNPSDREDLRRVSEHRPALHMELMLDGGSAIARELEANKASAPKQLLRAAILLDDTKDDFYFTGAPMRALMAVFVALAPVGRLLGYGGPVTGRTVNRRSRLGTKVNGACPPRPWWEASR